MRLEELQKLVAEGESEDLEFKKTTGQRTEAAKTVCALLNGIGGFVLFGISDKGEIVGQQVTTKTLEDITTELRRIEPPAFPDIETVTIENDRAVIVIRVSGKMGVYCYDGRPYIRHGPTTQLMPRGEYDKRILEKFHAHRRWENERIPDWVTVKDLDEEEIQVTLQNAVKLGRMKQPAHTDSESILRGLGLFDITPEKLAHPHESKPWNPIIASVFYRAGIIEKWGMGTLNIIEWCKKNINPDPIWEVRVQSVVTTFFPSLFFSRGQKTQKTRPELRPGSLEEKILNVLQENPLSKGELANILGHKHISGGLKKALQSLMKQEKIAHTVPAKPNSRLQKYRLKNNYEGDSK